MISNQRIAWNRDRPNFTEFERCFLNLVHQYLMQVEENVSADYKEASISRQFPQVLSQLGVIVLTSEAQVKYLTRRGEQLLSQYFPYYESYSLPELLEHWFKHQISLFMYQEKVLFPCFLLHIEQEQRQLLVRLSSSQIREQYLTFFQKNSYTKHQGCSALV